MTGAAGTRKRAVGGRPSSEGELHSVTVQLDARTMAQLGRLCADFRASPPRLVSAAIDALAAKNPSKPK